MAHRIQGFRRGRRSKTAKAELLGKVPLFARLSKRDLGRIAALVEEVDVPEGRVLVRRGDPGWECFVIAQGRARAVWGGKMAATLGPGDVVGEMSLLDRGPRTATVTASTEMHLLVLSSRNFSSLIDRFPLVARRIMVELAGRLRQAEKPRPAH